MTGRLNGKTESDRDRDRDREKWRKLRKRERKIMVIKEEINHFHSFFFSLGNLQCLFLLCSI
jgi:hypothetical protein